jgi:ribonuclease P protein component
MAPSLQPGWDVLIIARSAAIGADFQTLAAALQNLLRRGGVLGGRTTT